MLHMTLWVDWSVKPQHKQTNKSVFNGGSVQIKEILLLQTPHWKQTVCMGFEEKNRLNAVFSKY